MPEIRLGEPGTPQLQTALSETFPVLPVLSDYKAKKETHLICKSRWATSEAFQPQQ